MFKTFVPSEPQPNWLIVDATGLTLGRMAARIASVLRGKHKPDFTPNMATGDFVIVINADKVRITGSKSYSKVYTFYSGYPGGLRKVTAGQMLATRPERMVELAVKRMLPKGALGYKMYSRLKVYKGPAHPHAAQQPLPLEVK